MSSYWTGTAEKIVADKKLTYGTVKQNKYVTKVMMWPVESKKSEKLNFIFSPKSLSMVQNVTSKVASFTQ